MCNLYSITTNQAPIAALLRVINRYIGNLAPMPGVFPDYPAPVVRNTDDRDRDDADAMGHAASPHRRIAVDQYPQYIVAALAFLFEGHENLIIAVCRGYPLAVGYCRGEVYVGSDAIALEPFTDMISYLEDDDIVVMTRQGIEFLNARREFVRRSLAKINGSAGRA